jgi:hypothetical protein
MWQPVRFLLDEVGHERIEEYLMRDRPRDDPNGATAPVSKDAMLRWSNAMRSR